MEKEIFKGREIIVTVDNVNYPIEYERKDFGTTINYKVLFYNVDLIRLLGNPFEFGISTHLKQARLVSQVVSAEGKKFEDAIIRAINKEDAQLNRS